MAITAARARRALTKARKRAKRVLSPALYTAYESRVLADLKGANIPRHIGVIVDGNRRWAREMGFEVADGHRYGGEKLDDLMRWSDDLGVEVVTIWLLSTDNLTNRDPEEIGPLLQVISDVARRLSRGGRDWRIRLMGALDLLPPDVAAALQDAAAATEGHGGMAINIAVGYGGRQEIVDAVRGALRTAADRGLSIEQAAEAIDLDDIAAHLYTKGQPDPDLIIRTSGEQRLSGFLLWQTANAEFYFSDVYWPDFRRVDFLRAVREYAHRHRRFGG
ncbi:isoprenyl transferase [Cumulibacter manganitolerans]|uniref:isoprenyl transferase n=1 Tax=Cumulibacter manganitolerans TaxID=1884992 RepID=UPI001E41EFEC|nr:isoprenyl transferase [Cumulibacter manganitolerans]